MRGVSNKHCLLTFFIDFDVWREERIGSVVECLTTDREVAGSSLERHRPGVIVL